MQLAVERRLHCLAWLRLKGVMDSMTSLAFLAGVVMGEWGGAMASRGGVIKRVRLSVF